jgi:catalase
VLFLTKCFGITASDAERNLDAEKASYPEIVTNVLLMQANAAAKGRCPVTRGTHAKGSCARALFEVLKTPAEREGVLAARLAKGIFSKPGVYPAIVRFGNSDANRNSDYKPDVRSLSFSVDCSALSGGGFGRQDFSLQNAMTMPINDAAAFLAISKVLTAKSPGTGLRSLALRDKLRVIRTLLLAQLQSRKTVKAYQQLRYWSTVPFRHGPSDFVKYSATPSSNNPAGPLKKADPNALQEELVRHLNEDEQMSSFDFGIQFLDTGKMTYWGRQMDTNFWIENASVVWHETEAPFHTIGRLTLLPKSQILGGEAEAVYFDVTEHASPDSTPVGSMNRTRWHGEVASRKARMQAGVTLAGRASSQDPLG